MRRIGLSPRVGGLTVTSLLVMGSLFAACHVVSGLDEFTVESVGGGGTGGTGTGGGGGMGSGGSPSGTGGTGGTGGDGGAGGGIVAALTDDQLIARWFLDDAVDPGGLVADVGPFGHDLNFLPQGGNAVTYSLPTGRGVQWLVFQGGRLELAGDSNFFPAFEGRDKVMIEIVMGALSGTSTASRVVFLGPFNGDGDLALTVSDDAMDLRVNTMTAARWPINPLVQRGVHHICMDLTLPLADAVWAYLDGAARTDEQPVAGPLPSAVSVSMTPDFLIGNGNGVNASPMGRIAYVALYQECLPETVIMGHALRLLDNDDP